MINDLDIQVVNLQRMVRHIGYSLTVSKNGPNFKSYITNTSTQWTGYESQSENRLDAANETFEKFKTLAIELNIKLDESILTG